MPHDRLERTRDFALAVTLFLRTLPTTEEAEDAARQLRRDAKIADSPALIKESQELVAILTTSVKTAARNSNRTKAVPKG